MKDEGIYKSVEAKDGGTYKQRIAVTKFDSQPESYEDPRITQLRTLVLELIAERVQAGVDCLKAGDDRASAFFQDGIDAEEHFYKLLENLGYGTSS